ncbi:MFS transporter [Streptomyces sp. NBC_00239]|uniref:MFS transporter n=1 Tax=Streptomyces sp. NBC_00239 TaxID=2903640 RepID=UPI002E2D48E0|nr:MFS transporter [Streptomyces sp. NBC_00239]
MKEDTVTGTGARGGPPEPTRGSHSQWLLLGTVALAWFLVLLDDTAVAIALPSLGRDLGLGLAGLEWVVNIYTLAFAVLTLWGGMLADRHGARPVFLTGLAIFVGLSLGAALSPTGSTLIGMRAGQGAGAALMGPSALALLCTSFSGPRRAAALGVWSGVGATALAIGPLLGAILTDAFGWRSIFFLNVPLGILMLIATRAVLPRRTQPAGRPGKMDIAGGIASGLGLSAMIFGLTQANTYGWRSATLWSVMGLAAAGFTVFALIERHVTTPLLDRTLLRLPNFVAANALGLASLAIMCSLFFFLSLYLQFATGFSPVQAGVTLLPLSLLVAVVAPVAGWLVSRTGARILISAGMALTAAGLFTLAGINPGWGTRQLLPGLVIAGIGIGLSSTPITTAAMGAVPEERAGIASGTLNASRMIGLSLGIAIMGAIVAAQWPGDLADSGVAPQAFTDGIATGFQVNAAIALAAAILAGTAIRTPKRQPPQDSTPGESPQPRVP